MTISIGELQKNISIIKKAKEPIIVVDKRTGKKIAKILPLKEDDDLELFNELVKDLRPENKIATKEDIKKAYEEYLNGKYSLNWYKLYY